MKVYYLRLTQDDFDQAGAVWSSEVIDLYNNDVYKNYSTTKSNYGLNSLGDRTWTGINQISANVTDSGIISSGRYIDYSGRIDIMSYQVEFTNLPGTGDITPILDIYTIDDPDLEYPDEWASQTNNYANNPIFIIDSYRYARFVLRLNTTLDTADIGVEVLIRIEIDTPVMAPLYDRTRTVLDTFPEWMETRDLDSESATPLSVGAQLVNAVAGQWLDDLDYGLNYLDLQRYIDTADVTQVAWVYAAADAPEVLWSIVGDDVQLARTASLEEFYAAGEDEDVFFWDELKRVVYTRKSYENLELNEEIYNQNPHHVWNWFDDFGLMVDLDRHLLEDNETYKIRILDVHINRPGVGVEAFKLALRRELNLWQAFGATPDSNYAGATPYVLEMSDIEDDVDGATPYMGYDNVPNPRFYSLVEQLAEKYPTTWGYFKWQQSFWDVGGLENEGYAVLPYRLDATPVPEEYIQTGVGDGDDLLVIRPDAPGGTQQFTVRLKARGRQRDSVNLYPKVAADVYIYGSADRKVYDNPTVEDWLTVRITDSAATPSVYYHSFQLSSKSNVDAANPTNTANCYATYRIWAEDGHLDDEQIWYDASGNEYDTSAATPFSIHINDVDSVALYFGRFNPDIQAFADFPTTGNARAWWSDNSASKLTANNAQTALTYGGSGTPSVVFEPLTTSYTIGRWKSEKQMFNILMNGAVPDLTQQSMTITIPEISWNPYLEATPNKKYEVEIITQDDDGTHGAYVVDPDFNSTFISKEYLLVNGSANWDGAGVRQFSTAVTTLEFSIGSGATDYPVASGQWNIFEATQTTEVEGYVDENGPWRNGVPAPIGNTNFYLTSLILNRDDFNIPNTENFVVTWMGAEVLDNDNVIVWMDSNTVKPAFDDGTSVTYPDDAIEEEWDDDSEVYAYSPIAIRARLRPGIHPAWHPQVHSGWFYDRESEYYLYANRKDETVTSATPVLESVARQGAPIIVYTDEASPQLMRQVAFYDTATPGLTLRGKQNVYGSGTNKLFLGYEDLYEVSVTDLETGLPVEADTETFTNEISTVGVTDRDKIYEVTYKLNRSFYAYNDYIHTDGSQRTKLVFDKLPVDFGASGYTVTYEDSVYDEATPIDVPLNTFYTTVEEGFLFISFEEYSLAGIEVRYSPSKLLADGQDYMLITIRSVDEYGNPKPNQTFNMSTSWGEFDIPVTDADGFAIPSGNGSSSNFVVLTDDNGSAVVFLTAGGSTASMTGTVTITGDVSASFNFDIEQSATPSYRLTALPEVDTIPADGLTKVRVFGKVENSSRLPVASAKVNYRKGRDIYTVLNTDLPYDGSVTADSLGRFTVGPFTAATPWDPGYWFVMVETDRVSASATPQYDMVGDVVFWLETPDLQYGSEGFTNLSVPLVQMANAADTNPYYSDINGYPVYYDEATPNSAATPVTIEWEPPAWYAIPRYDQYQLGFLGSGFYDVTLDGLQSMHPDYRDV